MNRIKGKLTWQKISEIIKDLIQKTQDLQVGYQTSTW